MFTRKREASVKAEKEKNIKADWATKKSPTTEMT